MKPAIISGIIASAASQMRCSDREIRGSTRGRKNVAWARQVAMYVAWIDLPEIETIAMLGRLFGRERTTASYAVRKVAQAVKEDPRAAEQVAQVRARQLKK